MAGSFRLIFFVCFLLVYLVDGAIDSRLQQGQDLQLGRFSAAAPSISTQRIRRKTSCWKKIS